MIVDVAFKKKKVLSAISMKISRNANNVLENSRSIVCTLALYAQMFNFAPNVMIKGNTIIN